MMDMEDGHEVIPKQDERKMNGKATKNKRSDEQNERKPKPNHEKKNPKSPTSLRRSSRR